MKRSAVYRESQVVLTSLHIAQKEFIVLHVLEKKQVHTLSFCPTVTPPKVS